MYAEEDRILVRFLNILKYETCLYDLSSRYFGAQNGRQYKWRREMTDAHSVKRMEVRYQSVY